MTSRPRLLLAEAWRSLGANLSTTVAATMTVLIGMFLLGLFIALGSWTVSWSNHVKRQLVVKVYFTTNVTQTEKTDYARALQQNQYVKVGGIHYVSKEEGLRDMSKRYPDLVKNLPSNPLSDRIDVTPDRAENVDKLFQSLAPRGRRPTSTASPTARRSRTASCRWPM
jgi:cell division protein FtsX